MMRRLVLLARKELVQERWVIVGFSAVLAVFGFMIWIGSWDDPAAPTLLGSAATLTALFIPLLGLVLAHRMVVREYQAHTQLFIEALPLRRWEMLAAKFGVGFSALGLLAVPYVLTFAIISSEHAPRFLLVLTLRTLGYVLASWSLFFGFGLLGRLRFAAYLTLLFGLIVIQNSTSFEIGRFGPFALIDPSALPFERDELPLKALLQSAATACVLAGFGVAVALGYEGSVAERLSRKASPREVVALAVLISGEAVAAAWLAGKQPLDPFEFTSSEVVRSRSGALEIMYGWPALEPRAALVVQAFDELEQRSRAQLGLETFPPIRLAHNSLVAASEVRDRSSGDAGGILLETNLAATPLHVQSVLEHSAHSLFTVLSQGRAMLERHHWLLDGFAAWWTSAAHAQAREEMWVLALAGARRDEPSADAVLYWERTIEAAGERGATALAFTLVDTLAERHGDARVVALARSMLVRRPTTGLFAWMEDRRSGFAERLLEATGESWPSFLARWQRELRRRSTDGEVAKRLARVPADRGTVTLRRGSLGADVVYELSGPSTDFDRSCELLHASLPPYDQAVPESVMKRVAISWKAGTATHRASAPGLFQNGQRALLALQCRYPELGAPVRLAAARLDGVE